MSEITKDFIKFVGEVFALLIIFSVVFSPEGIATSTFNYFVFSEPILLQNYITSAMTIGSQANGNFYSNIKLTSGQPHTVRIFYKDNIPYVSVIPSQQSFSKTTYSNINPTPIITNCELLEQEIILPNKADQNLRVEKTVEGNKCKLTLTVGSGIKPPESAASTCSDGTMVVPSGQCSFGDSPKYCDNGNLIDKCTQCSCPYSDQSCNSATDSCYKPSTQCPDGTAYNSCSDANMPSWCNSTGSLILNQCGSPNNCPCPNPTDTCNADGSCSAQTTTCGNGICEPGETQSSCCNDCGCPSSQTCNFATHSCYTPTSTCDSNCKAQSFASGTCESGSTSIMLGVGHPHWTTDINGNAVDIQALVNLVADSGANVWREVMISAQRNSLSPYFTNLKSYLDQRNLKLEIQTAGTSTYDFMQGQEEIDVYMNKSGKQTAYINDWGYIIQQLHPYAIMIQNEPSNNHTFQTPSMTAFSYYRQFVTNCINAWRQIKPDLVIIVQNDPFTDPFNNTNYGFAANPLPFSNIIYTRHVYYAGDGKEPNQSSSGRLWYPEQMAYWHAVTAQDLANAKQLLANFIDKESLALRNENQQVMWDEWGANLQNPHATNYVQDFFDICKARNISAIYYDIVPFGYGNRQEPTGLLDNDYKTLNAVGQVWAASMPGQNSAGSCQSGETSLVQGGCSSGLCCCSGNAQTCPDGSSGMSVGVNYLSSGYQYTLTQSQMDHDFQLFKQNNITLIYIDPRWDIIETSKGTYDDAYLGRIKSLIRNASQYNIQVGIAFMTNTICTAKYPTIPSWVSPNCWSTVLTDSTTEQAWINMLAHTANYLKDVPVYSWLVLDEPYIGPKYINLSQAQAITLFVGAMTQAKAAIKQYSNAPFGGARFGCTPNGPSAFTDNFNQDSRLYSLLDFISINYYANWDGGGCNETKVGLEFQAIKANGKQIYIGGFGENVSDDTTQTNAVSKALNFFSQNNVDGAMAWWWSSNGFLPGSSSGNWDLCRDSSGTPRAAFYKLGRICKSTSCSCGSWTNGNCGAGSCSSTQRQQTRTCTPTGCTPSDGMGTSTCVPDSSCPVCGNGVIEGSEQCEGTNLNGKTCANSGYTGGTLKCTNCMFDFSGCTGGAQFQVNINPSSIIHTNRLSTGFDFGSSDKLSNPTQKQLSQNASFKMIRLYSINLEPLKSDGTYNWTTIDTFVQSIFSVGAEPIIVLGYIDSSGFLDPKNLPMNSTTGLPTISSFATYAREWVKHFDSKGYPVKYYEVMNEAWFYFNDPVTSWDGTKAKYFLDLYNAAYNAMHAENNSVIIGNDASLRTTFLNFWKANGGKLDMFTNHKYDVDNMNFPDSQGLVRAENRYFNATYESYFLTPSEARTIWGKDLPCFFTEVNWAAFSTYGTDPRIQKIIGAVHSALVLRSGILGDVDRLIYFQWSSGKTWESTKGGSSATGGFGFGMINSDNNQPWYPYYVYKMIGPNLAVGDSVVSSTSTSNDIRALSWNDSGKLNILLIHKNNKTETVSLSGVSGTFNYQKIDDPNNINYPNPTAPQTLTMSASQVITLNGYTVMLLQQTSAQTCTCGSWTNGNCGAGSCSSTQRQQTRTCTPSGCTPSDGMGLSRCASDTSCGTTAQYININENSVGTVPKLTWGANIVSSSNFDTLYNSISQSGVTMLRTDIDLNFIFPTSTSTPNFSRLDKMMSTAKKIGIEPLIIVDYTPIWLSKGGNSIKNPPTDMTKFNSLVATVVNHVKDNVTYYEIWNEPDSTKFWNGTVAEYASLLRNVSQIIRSADSNAKILAPAFSEVYSAGSKLTLLQEVCKNASSYFDIVSFHTYIFYKISLNGWLGDMNDFTQKLNQYGCGGKQLWMTEAGIFNEFLSFDYRDVLKVATIRKALLDYNSSAQVYYPFLSDSDAGTVVGLYNSSNSQFSNIGKYYQLAGQLKFYGNKTSTVSNIQNNVSGISYLSVKNSDNKIITQLTNNFSTNKDIQINFQDVKNITVYETSASQTFSSPTLIGQKSSFTLSLKPYSTYLIEAKPISSQCTCGGWINGNCGGSCGSGYRNQTRTSTPTGCTPCPDGLGLSRCNPDTSCGATAQFQVTVDSSKAIGSNNLSLGVQLDWERPYYFMNNQGYRNLAKDASLKLVRIFDYRPTSSYGYKNIMPCTSWNAVTKSCASWDWSTVDTLTDAIFSTGAEPLFCLGAAWAPISSRIPPGMPINASTGLPNTDEYATYAAAWVNHFKQTGKPVRFYELLNEPYHWYDSPSPDAQKLKDVVNWWNAAARAMRVANPQIRISNDALTQKEMLDYWVNYGDNVDSLDFHKYDTGTVGQYSDTQMFSRAESFMFTDSSSYYSVDNARQIWYSKRGKWLPVIVTEFNYNYNPDPSIQTMTGAVWTSLFLRKSMLENLSYVTYFEFSDGPNAGPELGMVNYSNNQPWYPYYVNKMVGTNLAVGDSIVSSSSNYANISSIAWNDSGKLNILLIHKSKQTATVSLSGVSGSFNFWKIDNSAATLQTGSTNAGDKITLNGYTVMLLTQTTSQSYKIYPFNRYNEWFNSKVGIYTFGTDYVQEQAQHDNSAVNTYFPLMTYMSMFNPLIDLRGKHFYIDAECEMVSASLSPSTGTPWLRTAVVAVVNESPPVNGYSDLYMEFDYYHGSGTNPQGSPTGDFNWEQVPGFPFNPGTGFHKATLDLTTAFVNYFGQSAYDNGKLWYISSTIELKNAQATVRCKNFTVRS